MRLELVLSQYLLFLELGTTERTGDLSHALNHAVLTPNHPRLWLSSRYSVQIVQISKRAWLPPVLLREYYRCRYSLDLFVLSYP